MKLNAKDVFKDNSLGDFRVAFVAFDAISGVEYLALRLFDEGEYGAYAVMRHENCNHALAAYMHSNITLEELTEKSTEHHIVVFDPSKHLLLETRPTSPREILDKTDRSERSRRFSC